MNVNVVAVGKVREPFYEEAVKEYSRRLSGYCSLSIDEVQDEKTKEAPTAREKDQILSAEASRIRKYLKDGRNTHTIALCIEGREYSSEAFAAHIKELMNTGTSTLRFVIGGSMGLHRDVTAAADEEMSFGRMTFPHQLMRVILLEQIYRAFRIIAGEPYHK